VLIRVQSRGFSLLELMVGVAILGILMAFAVPNLRDFFVNARVQTTAENFLAGVQKARAEAVAKNQDVQIILTDDAIATGIQNSVTPLAGDGVTTSAGRNWVVRYANPKSSDPNDPCGITSAYCLVEAKSSAESSSGGGAYDPTIFVAAPSWGSAIIFTSLSNSRSPTTKIIFSSTKAACQSAGGPVRCLAVYISPGGQSRLCDPSVTAQTDNRACPP